MSFKSLFDSYRHGKDGSTAAIAAFALVPMAVMLGFAIDMQRANSVKSHLQVSADAAVLAGAREYYKGGEYAADVTLAYFTEAIRSMSHGPNCSTPVITTDNSTAGVSISANCTIETTVGGIISSDTWTLSTQSSARSQQSKLDLALMLDVSGSMSGSRIADLKVAANNAVDILLAGAGNETRIALAPYSTAVNAGAYAEAAVGPDFDKTRANPTCISERPGKAKKKDDAPGEDKYVGYSASYCPSATVQPLTDDADELHAQINNLSAGGATAGQLGVAWSWYAIAPKWKDFWPADSAPREYDEPDATKAVILMTDGAFNRTYDPKQGNSVNQSKAMCKEMRKSGVTIYAVAFKAPPSGKAVLENCATSADTYFEPTNGDELIDVYGEIATNLSNLRLTN